MAGTITLNGNYGYRSYRFLNGEADVINASNASWTLANIGSPTNLYPFQVVNNDSNVRIIGGTINGQVSLTLDWQRAYVNSAGVRVEDTPQAIVEDWRITRAWDAIRLNGDSNGFIIDDVWVSDVRDDAVENDNLLSGTIRDSLFDGVFSGISSDGNGSGGGRTITLDGVLMRMESYLYKGKMTHMGPFKADTNASDNPTYKIHDSIFAIERGDHHGMPRMQVAFSKMAQVTNSYFLNLSNDPLPDWYPRIPSGFRYLQGDAARDFWEDARSDWIGRHGAARSASSSLSMADTIASADKSETPVGTAGADLLFGRGGNDGLSSATGRDAFVFDAKAGPWNAAPLTDFLHGTGGKAYDGNDHGVYNRNTDTLPWGSASGAPVSFAEMEASLKHDDVFIV